MIVLNKKILEIELNRKYLLLYSILLFTVINLFAQKGVVPLQSRNNQLTTNNTYAVIIGISDYQSPQIPDLQFADRDALAFADWIKSPAGGSLPDSNTIVLTNDSATMARVSDALNWLMETCHENDLAIIYFSGHGDVETKMRDGWGYLLCYDSPERNYISGAYPVYYLQSVISTISIEQKAKVLVITDACHAGKLAGSKINGSVLTNAQLTQQFANESKILSCQVNEFAIEGKQWGVGRGVFSWILIDGLNGLADTDEDQKITLMEIGRYLEEKVPYETNPHKQIPITVGDRSCIVALVDEATKNNTYKSKKSNSVSFQSVNLKGMEAGFLSPDDTLVKNKYKQFVNALEQKKLLSPPDSCAYTIYTSFVRENILPALHNLMRRNLAIAFQEEVQQALNSLLNDDPFEVNNWNANSEKFKIYPQYIEKAIQLLGEKHYFLNSLKSKKIFFETQLKRNELVENVQNGMMMDSMAEQLKSELLHAIELEPSAAYLYAAIGSLYRGNIPCRIDSLVFWNKMALELAPNWLTPMMESGFEHWFCAGNACDAAPWIERAIEIRPESYMVQQFYSWLLQWTGKIDESKRVCMQMIVNRHELFNAYATLAYTLTRIEGDYREAQKYLDQSFLLDSSISWAQEAQCDVWNKTGMYLNTIEIERKIRRKNPDMTSFPNILSYREEANYYLGNYRQAIHNIDSFFQLKINKNNYYLARMKYWKARSQFELGDFAGARISLEEIFEIDKANNALYINVWSWLAKIAIEEKKMVEADSLFQKAISYTFCGDGMDSPEPREEAHYLYGRFLLNQNRMSEAKTQMERAITLRRMGYWGEYGIAVYYALQGNSELCLKYLERACIHLFPHFKLIMNEPAFSNIIRNPVFKSLIKKYRRT